MKYDLNRLIFSGFLAILFLTFFVSSYAVLQLKEIATGLDTIVEEGMVQADYLRELRNIQMERIIKVEQALRFGEDYSDSGDEVLRRRIEKNRDQFDSLSSKFQRVFSSVQHTFTKMDVDQKQLLNIAKSNQRYTEVSGVIYERCLTQEWRPSDSKIGLLLAQREVKEKELGDDLFIAFKEADLTVTRASQRTKQVASQGRQRIFTITSVTLMLSMALAILLSKLTKNMSRSIQAYVETKDTLSDLAKCIREERDLKVMLRSTLSFIASKVPIGTAVYYVAEDHVLIPLASYAYQLDEVSEKNSFAFGEGLVGQCAEEKQQIRINASSENMSPITTGVGEVSPVDIHCLPVVHEKRLLGVISIGCTEVLNADHIELLGEMIRLLGIYVNTAQANNRLVELLKRSQTSEEMVRTANEELREQKTMLQSTNNALEEKQLSIQKQAAVLTAAKRSLEQKTRELQKANQYKSEFLANMSHELRTPLNSMLILSQDLAENREGNLSEQQVEDVAFIYEGGRELLDLINDILDLSKVEAGKLDIRMGEAEIQPMLRGLEQMFGRQCEQKGLTFTYVIEAGVPGVINSDSKRIEQILKNFLSNAIKFTEKGEVAIHVHAAAPETVFQVAALSIENAIGFTVKDSGIGIPEDKQQVIFEAFQQQDGSISRKYGGTGLGLAIARELSQLLSGEVQLKSEDGVGSEFTLYIPRTVVDSSNAWMDNFDGDVEVPIPAVRVSSTADRPDQQAQTISLSKIKNDGELLESDASNDQVLNDVVINARDSSDESAGVNKAVTKSTEDRVREKRVAEDEVTESKVIKDSGTDNNITDVKAIERETKVATERSTDDVAAKDTEKLAGKRVLLVDDDMRTVYSISAKLQALGLVVTMAENGAAALEAIREADSRPGCAQEGAPFDIIVMDIVMPVMDGVDATRHIRKIPGFETVPILTMSARSVQNELLECEGATDVISKPLEIPRLLECFNRLLQDPS